MSAGETSAMLPNPPPEEKTENLRTTAHYVFNKKRRKSDCGFHRGKAYIFPGLDSRYTKSHQGAGSRLQDRASHETWFPILRPSCESISPLILLPALESKLGRYWSYLKSRPEWGVQVSQAMSVSVRLSALAIQRHHCFWDLILSSSVWRLGTGIVEPRC